jgi:cytochrome c6
MAGRRSLALLGLLLALVLVVPDGATLFQQHCVGCHVNGGNIIRRNKTLRLAALERNQIVDAAAVGTIAAQGVGSMGGYAEVLGPGGAEAVGSWVWQQAQAGWPRG